MGIFHVSVRIICFSFLIILDLPDRIGRFVWVWLNFYGLMFSYFRKKDEICITEIYYNTLYNYLS